MIGVTSTRSCCRLTPREAVETQLVVCVGCASRILYTRDTAPNRARIHRLADTGQLATTASSTGTRQGRLFAVRTIVALTEQVSTCTESGEPK